METFLDCEQVLWLRKISTTVEKFLDSGKLTFLTAEKLVGLINLKANANAETIVFWELYCEARTET